MNVLIACEFSGVVRDAFRRKGHNAWSCDLLPSTSNEGGYHLEGDVRWWLDREAHPSAPCSDKPWDLMIAHPECTYLTGAAEWAYGDGPYHQKVKPGTLTGGARRAAREEAVKFVKELRACGIPKIALENPVGHLSARIGKPSQIIQPYNFGEDASKKTCLWLTDLPVLENGKYFPPRMVCTCGMNYPYTRPEKEGCPQCGAERSLAKPRWSNQTDSGQNNLSPKDDRWATRSVTYQGIANAMAEQWG